MACERNIERIQELIDGTLGPIRRAELEQHLAQCDTCRALRDDLEAVRDAGAALPQMRPPDGAWLQIAGRLRQEGRIRETAAPRAERWSYGWLAIAATLVLAAGASLLVLVRTPSPATAPSPASASGAVAAPASTTAGKGDPSVEAAQSAVDSA